MEGSSPSVHGLSETPPNPLTNSFHFQVISLYFVYASPRWNLLHASQNFMNQPTLGWILSNTLQGIRELLAIIPALRAGLVLCHPRKNKALHLLSLPGKAAFPISLRALLSTGLPLTLTHNSLHLFKYPDPFGNKAFF